MIADSSGFLCGADVGRRLGWKMWGDLGWCMGDFIGSAGDLVRWMGDFMMSAGDSVRWMGDFVTARVIGTGACAISIRHQ